MSTPPKALIDTFYAHRGLWADGGAPENSMAAFSAAAESGFGVELDVQLTADGVPICFHDDLLTRVTGQNGIVSQTHWDDIHALRLSGSDEAIPRLDEVLGTWPQSCPMLLEIKATAETGQRSVEAIAPLLTDEQASISVKSFDVSTVSALPRDLHRGLLIEPSILLGNDGFDDKVSLGLTELEVDFFSVWHTDAERLRTVRGAEHMPVAVWTIRTPEECKLALAQSRALIFEGFDPRMVASETDPDI